MMAAALGAWLAAATAAPAGPASVEIVYEASGGFAGNADKLEVWSDGRLALSRRGAAHAEGRLAPERLAKLRALLNDPAFRGLRAKYLPHDQCCDRILHTITVVRGGTRQTVATLDGVGWPAPLAEAIERLREIENGVGPAEK